MTETRLKGLDTCKGCGVKVPKIPYLLLEEHHLIPKRFHSHLDFKDARQDELSKTILLCGLCHKIAHVIIKDSENCYWRINFWEELRLIEEIKRFRNKFCVRSKY